MSNLYFVMPEYTTVEGCTHPTYAIVSPIMGVAHDVTCDRALAYDIARRFTESNLSPIHFFDAIEDSIV